MSDVFVIKLDKPWGSENYLPPEDPLGELSAFEMGLRCFCFERNHRVSIEIGNEKKYVFLFPDITLLIERVPQKIAELSLGKAIELEFPESMMNIELAPTDNKTVCTLRRFGQAIETKRFELDLPQVLAALRRFLEEVVQLAVKDGYISKVQADKFLLEMQVG